ncbi:MAG: 16S rRNA (uracil(1498)-N(3))-methyltransferase [Clostridia bacterium]|nr:16S rRNA (uracil(1498)-N(3))-methyltransferase [Clostridia bacterium]
MPRFFKENFESEPIITGADAAHIAKSLRMKPGEEVVVCDTHGVDYLCKISSLSPEEVALEIRQKTETVSEPTVFTTLFVCLPKGDKMDGIIKQAVELGVCEIVPMLSTRCVARPDARAAVKKQERYQKIANEAAGQSGRGILPTVRPFVSLKDCAAAIKNFDRALFFYEKGGAPIDSLPMQAGERIALITGCEGGFDPAEAALLQNNGAVALTLGPRILRAETAPAAALSAVMLLTGNFGA